jgi:hypothetical protein
MQQGLQPRQTCTVFGQFSCNTNVVAKQVVSGNSSCGEGGQLALFCQIDLLLPQWTGQ